MRRDFAPWRARQAIRSSVARAQSIARCGRLKACCPQPGRGGEGAALLERTETDTVCAPASAGWVGLWTGDRATHAGAGRTRRRADDLRWQFRRRRRRQDAGRAGAGADADRRRPARRLLVARLWRRRTRRAAARRTEYP